MAISPRAGVINLDFKDVSKMAKEIEANDPWKNAIATFGKVLSDRERDILYRRALAQAQGIEAPDETTAGEGLGWVGGKLADAYDWTKEKLSSPDLAPTQTEEYRTEVGTKKVSPIAENPEDIIESPEDVMNAGKKVEMVDGLPSTMLQAPKERVTFPTTVTGTVERSVLPQTTVQKPVSPVAGAEGTAEQLEAPDRTKSQMEAWSEMYRISPDRATFDWNRIAPKGSGAAGTVQARLEHDMGINVQIADLTTQLISDMKANGWTTDSPEYIQRYNEIIKLNATKYNPDNKNDVDKYIDRELAGSRVETAKKKQKLAEDKELNDQDMEAISLAYDTSKDTLGKAKDVAVQIGKVNGLLKEGINGNAPAISAAAKILIQSFDNSAVLGNEIGMLANQSWLGQLNSLVEKGLRGTTYTKEDVKNLWDIANAIAEINNTYVSRVSQNASAIYRAQQGTDSKTIPLLFNGYKTTVEPLPSAWNNMPGEIVDLFGKSGAQPQGGTGGAVLHAPQAGTGKGANKGGANKGGNAPKYEDF